MSRFEETTIKYPVFPANGDYSVDVQHPFPTDGDSVYVKDVDCTNSSIGTFTGTIASLFDNIQNEITDATATNPKTFTIVFNRPISTSQVGIASKTGNFSNVKLIFKTVAGDIRYTFDDSANATKYTSNLYETGPLTFDTVTVEFHTTDTIKLAGITIPKIVVTESHLAAISTLSGLFENITSYRNTLNVNNAWVHRKIVNETFHKDTGTQTTPSVAIVEGDTSVTLTSAVGFAIGSELVIYEGSTREIGLITITNLVGNIATLDRPIGNPYTTAATIKEVTSNMAVNGSLASPQIFEIDPPVGTVWQLTRVLFSITSTTAMDDAKFGGITALTNGVSLRATTAAGRTVVFGNWKSNDRMKLDMYDVDYSVKAPAGVYGLSGRWTFTRSEVVAELDGDASPVQKMELLIQDDLTGLSTFYMQAQGRVESP